jgi:signal transduction histidine kinase/streptogramin lyase
VTRYKATEGLPGTGGCWLTTDAKGQLWFAKAGRVGVFRDGEFVTLLTLPERSVRIGQRRAGGVWICAGLRLLRYEEGEEPNQLQEIMPDRTGVEPSVLFEDRRGAVWIGTLAGGLFHYDGTNVVKAEASAGDVRGLVEDREGSLWFGIGGGGLNRLRSRVLELQGVESGLPVQTVRSVCEDTMGVMWAVAQNGALARFRNGKWSTMSTNEGWSGARATCVASDGGGGVWIGTYKGGLNRWDKGKISVLGRREGLAGDIVRSLLTDRAGNLWIGLEASNCLQRLHEGQLRTYEQPPNSRTIRTIAEDSSGNIWLGTTDGFLLRVKEETLVDETPGTLARPRPIRCLYATTDGSVWIAYSSAGLGRLRDGKFAQIGMEQGLPDNSLCGIGSDGQGALWFAADHGIFQVRQRELDALAEGKTGRVLSIVYGQDEALPNLQGNYGYGPNVARRRDGTIWFSMLTGVAVAHPDRVQPNRIPPPVLIERLMVDGRATRLLGEGSTLRVPPGYRKVDVEFTAPTFVAPENVQFQHRLKGWEEDWNEPTTQRHVSYPPLPHGEYVFQVRACNNVGVWSKTAAAVSLVVQPFFWQTWWFRLGTSTVLALALAWGVRRHERRRVRQRIAYLEQRHAIERERTRIARDIHDELGAGLAQIGLLADLGVAQPADAQQAQSSFSKIGVRARTAVGALDEIVWAANPRNDNLPRLADYLCHLADECFETGPIRCRKEVPTGLPPVPVGAELRHNLALAVKEALANVLKHSGAQNVWLRLSWEPPDLRVSVEDDGVGLPGSEPGQTADGLRNQLARMNDIGGTAEVQSAFGRGTKVSFHLRVPTQSGVHEPGKLRPPEHYGNNI